MKKPILFCIAFFILFFTSCSVFNLGKKKQEEKERTTKTTELSEVKKDSSNIKKVNVSETKKETLPIDKSSSISLQTADSIANKRINEALRNFKITDRSGGNSFSAKYDEVTMRLVFDAYIEGTRSTEKETNTDQLINTNTESKTDKTFEEEVSEKSERVIKMIPLWIWIVAGIFFLPTIINRVMFIINPLKGVISKLKG